MTKHDEMIGIYTDKLPRSKLLNSVPMATDPAIDDIMFFLSKSRHTPSKQYDHVFDVGDS